MDCHAPPSSVPRKHAERVWKHVSGTWQPLFGSFYERGVSIEWHDFRPTEDIDCTPSFHPGSLELCLNFSGTVQLQDGTAQRECPAGHIAIYTARQNAPRTMRMAGSWHRFITWELSPSFLRTQCAGKLELLKLPLQRFVEGDQAYPPVLEILPMSTSLLALRGALLEPPVPSAAREAWFLAKTLEVLAYTAFQDDDPSELFCQRHQRQNRERVERVRYLLERDLENPPSLEMLAADVGCSTFHLSRIFAEQTMVSIPKFLRTRRIEKAAELLASGKSTVTEAAMAVGYSSLSAFNKAFVEQVGCCPGLYPAIKTARRKKA